MKMGCPPGKAVINGLEYEIRDDNSKIFCRPAYGRIAKVMIPSDVCEIQRRCFAEDETLREITFEAGSNLRLIGDCAFMRTTLRSITIPSSVEEIGINSFSGYDAVAIVSISEVTFEKVSKLERIGRHAFCEAALKTIEIPSSVEEIGDYCFYQCFRLREVYFENGSKLKKLGACAFCRTDLSKIEIPSKCQFLGGSFGGIESVTISKENPFFLIENSFIKNRSDRKRLISCLGSEPRICVDDEIEVIGNACFYDCYAIREVMFGLNSKLREIKDHAFQRMRLVKIQIPSTVEVIGEF
jgi:hypothetical protein